jgi:hypothetical protein
MFRLTTLRAATVLAVLGAMSLAGCGGGGSKSMGPLPAGAAPTTQNNSGQTTGFLSIVLPTSTSATAQSTKRAILSSSKKPTFIDTTTPNSAIVVSVTPQDPSEASQFGNLTVCYNLYTNGTLDPNATGFTVLPAGGPAATVTIAVPAPPGTDTFQITQYAGQCGSTPYTIPTPSPTNIGATNILAQTPPTMAYMAPGVSNNLNIQIADCTPAPAAGSPCPLTVGGLPPGATLAASVTIATIAFGAIPIADPVREQGAFLLATGKIGVPIPLEALDAAGSVISGLTTIANPNGGAGPFPSGVTVTWSDATHTALYLVDATNGAIAQKAASNTAGLSIHEFNALSGAVATGGNDITFPGSTAVAGDPWVIIMTSDGVDASKLASVLVTAAATIPPAASATTISTTITPQSTVYSAGGTGYADVAAPTAPAGLLQVGTTEYFTDGNKVKIDGTATASGVTGTSLTGLTAAQWPTPANPIVAPSFIYAVDQAQAVGTSMTEVNSGVYAYNPATLVATGVSAQDGSGHYLQFANPVAVAQGAGVSGSYFLYVVDKNGSLWILDIANGGLVDGFGNQIASNVQTVSTGALSPGTATYLATAALSGGNFLVADPGNSRIAQVNAATYPATITTWATGAAFTGLYLTGTGTAAYATSTTGQIYFIPSGTAPQVAVSLGLTTGTALDGPVGQLSPLGATPTGTLAPVNYPLQFQSGSYFDSAHAFAGFAPYAALAAPYTVAPFPGGKAFAAPVAAGVGLTADTSAGGTTGAGKVNATGGIVMVPTTATAGADVTPDSLLFVDSAGAGGKLRTLVR